MRASRILAVLALFTVCVSSGALAAGKKSGKLPPLPAGKATFEDTVVPLEKQDEARKVAEDYLKSISHQGNDGAIESLLGGATLTARMFTIENWKLVARKEHRHEKGEIPDLNGYVAAIDRAGRDALSAMLGGGPAASTDDDGLGVQEISVEQAQKILEPTRRLASQFKKSHPVFAYVARVDKEVYWHPKNPFRKFLADSGGKGTYEADLDYFTVETVEGAHEDKHVRRWPLRVVRFRVNGTDTGLKILPASDWNAE